MVLIGLPAGIQGSLFSISNVFIQSAVNSFDSALIVSGNTAASNIEGFVWTAVRKRQCLRIGGPEGNRICTATFCKEN